MKQKTLQKSAARQECESTGMYLSISAGKQWPLPVQQELSGTGITSVHREEKTHLKRTEPTADINAAPISRFL